MLDSVLSAYDLTVSQYSITPFGSGLINRTWKITGKKEEYILQCVNHEVFKRPEWIAENIQLLSDHLKKHFPEYLFIEPIRSAANTRLVVTENGEYFRLLPFVPASYSYDVVGPVSMAYEAARQFGKFSRLLSGFPAEKLHITLTDFHNLSLRYQQFETALKNGDPERAEEAKTSIALIQQYKYIVKEYEKIKKYTGFKKRVMHHDTKISNVLFDKDGYGLCVIDLDTVMPGYFISDFGDMLRTYLSPVSEEEKDLSKIVIREDYFNAIVSGYLREMRDELSDAEALYLVYAGKFMIYMQAIRFLTDHLNNDSYYGARYKGHNLIRSNNQLSLLQRLSEKEEILNRTVTMHLQSLT
jgi:Ser/Thr protein kinase RdoA (MazF antagonist)